MLYQGEIAKHKSDLDKAVGKYGIKVHFEDGRTSKRITNDLPPDIIKNPFKCI